MPLIMQTTQMATDEANDAAILGSGSVLVVACKYASCKSRQIKPAFASFVPKRGDHG